MGPAWQAVLSPPKVGYERQQREKERLESEKTTSALRALLDDKEGLFEEPPNPDQLELF